MSENITRQVKLSRELIAALEAEQPSEPGDMARAIGRLESRLEMLCDAIEEETPVTQ